MNKKDFGHCYDYRHGIWKVSGVHMIKTKIRSIGGSIYWVFAENVCQEIIKKKIRHFVLSKSLTVFNLTGSEKAHKLDFEGNVPLFTVQNGLIWHDLRICLPDLAIGSRIWNSFLLCNYICTLTRCVFDLKGY